MIDYEYFDLFNADSVDKQFYIEYAGGTITNEELFSDSIEITEKLCSEDTLRFGSCESNYIKFKVAGIYNLEENSEITVSVSLSEDKSDPFIDNPKTSDRFVIGKYYVKDNTLTADRMWREVTAYDAMHYIINADVTDWYNGILPEKDSEVSLWQLRKSFAQHFGLEEVVPADGLINDNMTVKRTIDPEQINGKDVLTAICEINGCFGHIGRDGKLHYIYLEQNIQGLYPADDLYPDRAPEYLPQSKTGHLYPQNPKPVPTIAKDKNYIEPPEYEDFLVKWITHVQIRGSENDAGYTYPAGNITENDNLYVISDNFLVYGKTDAEMQQITSRLLSKITDITYRPYRLKVRANPCLELGDPIRVNTDYHVIESYVLQRTMSGIQAFYDSLYAKGTKKCEENTNSAQRAIIQLKGKTNELTRTSEETRSELKDLESETESRFVQTAEEIQLEVIRAQGAESHLSSNITQNAEQIALKVSKGDVSSQLSVESGQITISSNRLVVDSTNFKLDEQGRVFIKETLQFESGDETMDIIYREGHLNRPVIDVYSGYFGGDVTVEGAIYGNLEGSASTAEYAAESDIARYAQNAGRANNADSADYSYTAYGLSGTPSIRVSDIYLDGWSSGSSLLPVGMNASTGHFGHLTGSSRRFKNSIADLFEEDLNPKRLYNIPVRQFKYSTDYLKDKKDCRYDTFVPGFIAEELEKEYRVAVDYSNSGEVMDWNYKYIIPPMLALIQEQHREIEELKMSLLTMRGELAILRNQMEELKNAK